MTRKYEFTGETKEIKGRILHRIRALRDFCCVQVNLEDNSVINNFCGVRAGQLGGWIEREENLSHEGDCWVGPYAHVYDWARVFGNACISDESHVYGNAQVSENAIIMRTSHVYGNSKIKGNVWVLQEEVCGNRVVDGDNIVPCIQNKETK